MVMTLLTRPKTTVGSVVVAADGSGHTTDIQTGIDLLPATGGCVYIKEGVYTIDVAIIVPQYTAIKGCGFSTQITTNNAINIFEANGAYITIEDLYINGNGVALIGIYIMFAHGFGNYIRGVWINDCQDGIHLVADAHRNTILGNHIGDNSRYGIRLVESDFNKIIGNDIFSNDTYGIYLNNSEGGNVIEGNNILFNNVGIYNDGGTASFGNLINDNIFFDNSNYAIHLNPATSELICGNKLIESGDSILLSGASFGNHISNNHILPFDIGGLQPTIVDSSTLIEGNQIFNNFETDIRWNF